MDKKPVVAHSVVYWLPLTMSWIYNQLRYMDGFFSIVLTDATLNLNQFPCDPIYSIQNKYKYLALRGIRKLGFRIYPSIYDKAIKAHCPVILHSHFADRGWYDMAIAKKYGLKHAVTFYGFDVNMLPTQKPIWKERYKELFEKADLFLCEGPHMAKCLINLGCPKEKVKVQRLGVEVDKIPFVSREIGNDGLIRILVTGTFREKKGIPYALDAFGQVRHRRKNIELTLIGDSGGQLREKAEKSRILEVIKRYNLKESIRMLGFQPRSVFLEELKRHHIFLSPSVHASDGDTEGGVPVSIIEASASGMPVLSTYHCDIPEVVIDGKSGFLVPERDVSALAERLEYLILNPSLWEEMGRKGRSHIEQNYNVKMQVSKLEEIYDTLIS